MVIFQCAVRKDPKETSKPEFGEQIKTAPVMGAVLDCRKTPLGIFRQTFAVCCAHNLFACSKQIPHLQPEMYFLPGTRPGRKSFDFIRRLLRRTLRGFWSKLRRHPWRVPSAFYSGSISNSIWVSASLDKHTIDSTCAQRGNRSAAMAFFRQYPRSFKRATSRARVAGSQDT